MEENSIALLFFPEGSECCWKKGWCNAMVNAIRWRPTSRSTRRLQSGLSSSCLASNCILVRFVWGWISIHIHRLMPKNIKNIYIWSCGIIPAITETQQFSVTASWRSASSFRDLMRAEKLLMMMMMMTSQPCLISGACLPLLHSLTRAGSIIYTRLVGADLTPNLFVWPCCVSAGNQTRGSKSVCATRPSSWTEQTRVLHAREMRTALGHFRRAAGLFIWRGMAAVMRSKPARWPQMWLHVSCTLDTDGCEGDGTPRRRRLNPGVTRGVVSSWVFLHFAASVIQTSIHIPSMFLLAKLRNIRRRFISTLAGAR